MTSSCATQVAALIRRGLGVFALAVCGLASAGAAAFDAGVAARVNGAPLHVLTLDVMTGMAQLSDPKATRAAVLDGLIATRLLAQTARRELGPELFNTGASRVGFDAGVALDDQLYGNLRTVYRERIEAAIGQLAGGNLNELILERGAFTAAQLDRVFGAEGKLVLDYSLAPAQLAAAKQLVLLRSALPAAASITLYDVFVRQNVQGRVEFFNRNRDFMHQQAMLVLANGYLQDWAVSHFSNAALLDLRQALAEQRDVQTLMALHGIGVDTDSQSKLLDTLAQHITAGEVRSYYAAHKDEFKRIIAVKARHIRIDDEVLARQVQARAAKGENFEQLARRYSNAPDAARGGDLGRVLHGDKLDWLAELAFMQDEGKVSAPIRSAVGPGQPASWEIVLVEQRQEGYQENGSEAVRYQATRALAQQHALQQLAALRKKSRMGASIDINRQVLLAPTGRGGQR